jgi:hypothetical protein
MAYNESGHARNVANFDELLVILQTFGADYQPSLPAIQLTNLLDLKAKLTDALNKVNEANGKYRDKIYERQSAYDQMSGIAMRVVNAMIALDLDAKLLAQGKSLLSKVRSGSGKRKKDEEDDDGKSGRTISVSQMSFDQRKNNFSALVGLVEAQARYTPNEKDVQIVALKKYIDSLQGFNEAALVEEQNLAMARKERDALLYANDVGVIALVQKIKAYVKSAFNTKSQQYERLKGVQFSKIKIGR